MPPNSARPGSKLRQPRLTAKLSLRLHAGRLRDRAPPRTAAAFMPAGPPPATMMRLLCGCRRLDAEGQFASGFGMLDAGDRITLVEVPDAGLVAGDAGADIIDPTFGRLGRHLGVADHGARHAAHVGLSGGEHLFSDLRLVDAPGHEDRLPDQLLQRCRKGCRIGIGEIHRRDDVDRAFQTSRRTGDHIEIVDHAVAIEHLAEPSAPRQLPGSGCRAPRP